MADNYNGSYAELVTDIAKNVELVFEAGQKSEYDRFWDAFQDYGNRTNYVGAFKDYWNEETFKPKYDLKPTGLYAGQMFQNNPIKDFKGHLEKCGVKLDTSECTSLLQMFQSSKAQYIPIIDARKANNNTSYAFSPDTIISIEKLIVSEQTIYGIYMIDSANLENIIFEGTIANNGLKLSNCKKLSHESLMSIKRALKNGVSGLTVTFSTKHKEDGKLTDSDIAEISAKGWSVAFQ